MIGANTHILTDTYLCQRIIDFHKTHSRNRRINTFTQAHKHRLTYTQKQANQYIYIYRILPINNHTIITYSKLAIITLSLSSDTFRASGSLSRRQRRPLGEPLFAIVHKSRRRKLEKWRLILAGKHYDYVCHYAGSSTVIGSFPIANLLPAYTDKYFRYEGSLTTPPCAESVLWTIFLHTQTVSPSQVSWKHVVYNFRDDVRAISY